MQNYVRSTDKNLPGYDLYAPGELSRMKMEDKSCEIFDRSLV